MNKNLLIIDDEQGIRDLFKFMLEPKGFEVTTADNGEKGLDMAKKHDYSLIFLDVHMPKMRGPEVLKEIKKMKPQQKVVMFSSSSDPEFTFEKEAEKSGAIGCIYKPFTIDEVIKILKEQGLC